MNIAALYSNGRMVTGRNHGEAFGKLSREEKKAMCLESGFYDSETGRFFTDCGEFYIKQIFLIRHGEAFGNYPECDLTELGITQAENVADFITSRQLSDFSAFTSPYLRCRRTANIISRATGIEFTVESELRECQNEENFISRIETLLCRLPSKSLLLTHGDFISNFVFRATGQEISRCENGGIIFIDSRRVVEDLDSQMPCCNHEMF